MKIYFSILSVLAIFVFEVSYAAPPDNSNDVIKHLEFMGYDVSMDSKRISAKHSGELNFSIRKYKGGMLFTAFLGATEYGKDNKNNFLSLVNKMNQKASVVRYYIDSDGDLVVEGYIPGVYNKKVFGAFVGDWQREKLNVLGADDIEKYLQ